MAVVEQAKDQPYCVLSVTKKGDQDLIDKHRRRASRPGSAHPEIGQHPLVFNPAFVGAVLAEVDEGEPPCPVRNLNDSCPESLWSRYDGTGFLRRGIVNSGVSV